MRRLLTGLGGALGLAWLWSRLNKPPRATQAPQADAGTDAGTDPVTELRAKLEEARGADDDRDEFDAAEGQPVDAVERPPAAAEPPELESEPEPEPEQTLSLDERRRAVHEKAQQALGEMDKLGRDD
jgi:hypothetical protein